MRALFIASREILLNWRGHAPQATTLPHTQTRIAALDGLRGIAILLVVFFHYFGTQLEHNQTALGQKLYKITSLGWVGVDLFFVLSGFLIGTILIEKRESQNYFSTFYMRRLVRIVPNYFLFLCLFALIGQFTYFSNNKFLTDDGGNPLWSYFFMVQNLFMAYSNNMGNDALSVSWSIGIEEQFYIVFPVLVYYLPKKWLPWLLGILIITSIGFRSMYNNWIPRYVLLPCRMDALLLGFMIAYLQHERVFERNREMVTKILGVSFFAIIGLCGLMYAAYNDLGLLKHSLFAMIFSILLVLSLMHPKIWYSKFLSNPALRWIGMISYSLYLFHFIILGLLHQFMGNTSIGIYDMGDLGITSLALLISIIWSWGIYRLLETPMVAWGKKFKY